MHFTATCHLFRHLKYTQDPVSMAVSRLSDKAFTTDLNPPTHPLNPINPDNACTLRITAAAGTELAGAYSYGTFSYRSLGIFYPIKRSLQPIGPSSFTRDGWFRLAPIDQYSSLLPPVGVWSVSQYQCGDHLSGPY